MMRDTTGHTAIPASGYSLKNVCEAGGHPYFTFFYFMFSFLYIYSPRGRGHAQRAIIRMRMCIFCKNGVIGASLSEFHTNRTAVKILPIYI